MIVTTQSPFFGKELTDPAQCPTDQLERWAGQQRPKQAKGDTGRADSVKLLAAVDAELARRRAQVPCSEKETGA